MLPLVGWSQTCLFTPPSGWQPLKPKDLSRTQIGFAKKGSSYFNPSINLATEKVDCDLKEYLKAVKQIHLSGPNTRWSDLGNIEMKAGVGRLTEVRKPSPCGEIVLLQSIFLKGDTAYILTAAVLKKELISCQKEILSSFRSLELTPNLWSAIKDEDLKDQLLSHFEPNQKNRWDSFQQLIEKKTSDLGAYWQYIALQEGHAKLHAQ